MCIAGPDDEKREGLAALAALPPIPESYRPPEGSQPTPVSPRSEAVNSESGPAKSSAIDTSAQESVVYQPLRDLDVRNGATELLSLDEEFDDVSASGHLPDIVRQDGVAVGAAIFSVGSVPSMEIASSMSSKDETAKYAFPPARPFLEMPTPMGGDGLLTGGVSVSSDSEMPGDATSRVMAASPAVPKSTSVDGVGSKFKPRNSRFQTTLGLPACLPARSEHGKQEVKMEAGQKKRTMSK